MRKNKFLAALAIAACLATSVPLSANAATLGQATDASKVTYAPAVTDAEKALLFNAFDAKYYAEQNPDLVAAGLSGDALFNHFITRGIFEARSYSADFNVSAYKSMYGDLRDAYGNQIVKYYIHYLTNGKAEKRLATVDAVSKYVDVVSAVDGVVVAKKQATVAATPSTSTSSSSDNGAADEIAQLTAELAKLKAELKELQDNKDATDAAKAAAEKAVKDAEKALKEAEEIKNAQGDKSKLVEAENEKYEDGAVKMSQTIKNIPTASVAFLPNGATEAKFQENVWYDYADGKFYTLTENKNAVWVDAKKQAKAKYVCVDGKYYKRIYKLDFTELPNLVQVLAENEPVGKEDTYIIPDNRELWRDTPAKTVPTDYADEYSLEGSEKVVTYVKNGVEKSIVFNSEIPEKYADWKGSVGVFNVTDEYVTTDPGEKINLIGKLDPVYWVQSAEREDRWYVVADEKTTYHTQAGAWNYKLDKAGNRIYDAKTIFTNGYTYTYKEDGKTIAKRTKNVFEGFVAYNTEKTPNAMHVKNSPYLRVEPETGKQYTMKYVAADRVTEDYSVVGAEIDEIFGIADDQQAYVTAKSVSDGSISTKFGAYAQALPAVASKEAALVNWYRLHYVFGSQEEMLRIKWENEGKELVDFDADELAVYHADEFYSITVDPGYELCLTNLVDGFAYSTEEVLACENHRLDGWYEGLTVRPFKITADYKVACDENKVDFALINGKHAVLETYGGTVWFDDGKGSYADVNQKDGVNKAKDSEKDTNRALQFNKLNRTVDAAEKNWKGETGILVTAEDLKKLDGSSFDFHGYVYVHVVAEYDKDGNNITDPKSQDRWYPVVDVEKLREDGLYTNYGVVTVDGEVIYYNVDPVDESEGAEEVPGYYDNPGGYRITEVTTLGEAFDLVSAHYGINKLVQCKENGRFYVVPK